MSPLSSPLNIDETFVRQASGGNEFYHLDAMGSTVALSSPLGVAVTSYNYEAFGKTVITGASANPFQYTGRENDGTGLYYYRSRYYASMLHRFLNEDSVKFRLGNPNLYHYAFNAPLRFADPFGLDPPSLGRIEACQGRNCVNIDFPANRDPELVKSAVQPPSGVERAFDRIGDAIGPYRDIVGENIRKGLQKAGQEAVKEFSQEAYLHLLKSLGVLAECATNPALCLSLILPNPDVIIGPPPAGAAVIPPVNDPSGFGPGRGSGGGGGRDGRGGSNPDIGGRK